MPARRKYPIYDALVIHVVREEEGGDCSTIAGTRLMEAGIQVRFLCWVEETTD